MPKVFFVGSPESFLSADATKKCEIGRRGSDDAGGEREQDEPTFDKCPHLGRSIIVIYCISFTQRKIKNAT